MTKITRRKIQQLLISHTFLEIGKSTFILFMSVFIWEVTNEVRPVVIYNVTYLLTHVLSFGLCASFVKQKNPNLVRSIGLIFFSFASIYIYLLGESAVGNVVLVAILLGISNGMYYMGYQVLRFDFTSQKNRGKYMGSEKGLKIGVNIIMPVFLGWIISMDFFNFGYSNIFALGAVSYFIAALTGNVGRINGSEGRLHLIKTLREVFGNKDILKANLGVMFAQVSRGSLLKVLLPVLIFDILQNEFELGSLLSFFAGVSIIASWLIGRYLKYKHYSKLLLVGGLFFSISILMLVGFPALLTYAIFGVAKEIFPLFLDIPRKVISENLLHHIKDYKSHRVEYMVIREFFGIGLGRVFSYIPLLFITDFSAGQLKIALFLTAGMVLLEALFIRSTSISSEDDHSS